MRKQLKTDKKLTQIGRCWFLSCTDVFNNFINLIMVETNGQIAMLQVHKFLQEVNSPAVFIINWTVVDIYGLTGVQFLLVRCF